MKLNSKHIFLSFLVLGLLSLTTQVSYFSHENSVFTENEFEELITTYDDVVSEKDSTKLDFGGSALLLSDYSIQLNPHFYGLVSLVVNSKELSQKPPFFILYCSLKVDC